MFSFRVGSNERSGSLLIESRQEVVLYTCPSREYNGQRMDSLRMLASKKGFPLCCQLISHGLISWIWNRWNQWLSVRVLRVSNYVIGITPLNHVTPHTLLTGLQRCNAQWRYRGWCKAETFCFSKLHLFHQKFRTPARIETSSIDVGSSARTTSAYRDVTCKVDTLTLATRQLVWMLFAVSFGGIRPTCSKDRIHALLALSCCQKSPSCGSTVVEQYGGRCCGLDSRTKRVLPYHLHLHGNASDLYGLR